LTRSEHKADLITALVLIALGAAMLVGGYTMDRLEVRDIHPASIPGLVPMMLGAALAVAALLLLLRSMRRLRATTPETTPAVGEAGAEPHSRLHLGIALVLTVGYAVGLVGQIPYEIATGVFVFLFIAVFEWEARAAPRRRALRLGTALLQAVLVAGIVSVTFEYAFLVRLP
jgi:putative tricarboxylic transport membrane protein